MRFIRVHGRVVPVKEKTKQQTNRIVKHAKEGARFGGFLAASGVIANHVSNLTVKGKTTGNFKNTGKAIGFGLAVGAGLGAMSGMFRKKKTKNG